MIVVVATTEDELASVRRSLGERGVGTVQVVAPSETRRLVLAAVDDEWEAHHLASSLRAEGRSAVTRPDGGARLEQWMRHTRPVGFGERLSVCFAWSEHDRGDLSGLIELGAGGFGSGQHPSTRLLIELLVERIRGGERVPRRRVRQRRARIVRAATRGVVRGRDRREGRGHRRDPTQRRAQWHGRAGGSDAGSARGDRGRVRRRRRRTWAGRRSSSSRPSSCRACRRADGLRRAGSRPRRVRWSPGSSVRSWSSSAGRPGSGRHSSSPDEGWDLFVCAHRLRPVGRSTKLDPNQVRCLLEARASGLHTGGVR